VCVAVGEELLVGSDNRGDTGSKLAVEALLDVVSPVKAMAFAQRKAKARLSSLGFVLLLRCRPGSAF
jgi:hypothetical protein